MKAKDIKIGMRVTKDGEYVGIVSRRLLTGRIRVYKEGIGSEFDTVDEFAPEELENAGAEPKKIWFL